MRVCAKDLGFFLSFFLFIVSYSHIENKASLNENMKGQKKQGTKVYESVLKKKKKVEKQQRHDRRKKKEMLERHIKKDHDFSFFQRF